MHSLTAGAPAMDDEQNIGEIEHELALLRARYDGYRRAAGLMKVFVIMLACLAAIAAVNVFLFDALYGIFFLGMLLVFAVAATAFALWLDLRWIDFVSQSPRGIYNPYFFHPEIEPQLRARSDAALIERQITDRERRLEELTAGGSGAGASD